jgi:hypothetical protein
MKLIIIHPDEPEPFDDSNDDLTAYLEVVIDDLKRGMTSGYTDAAHQWYTEVDPTRRN